VSKIRHWLTAFSAVRGAESAIVGTYDSAAGGLRIEEYPITRLPVVVSLHEMSMLGLSMDQGR
jgi:hypothetical protein